MPLDSLRRICIERSTSPIQVDNVESKRQELTGLGVEFVSPPKRQFRGYGAEVLDPDGYSYMKHMSI